MLVIIIYDTKNIITNKTDLNILQNKNTFELNSLYIPKLTALCTYLNEIYIKYSY